MADFKSYMNSSTFVRLSLFFLGNRNKSLKVTFQSHPRVLLLEFHSIKFNVTFRPPWPNTFSLF